MLRIHDVFIIQKTKKCEVDLKKGGYSSKQRSRKQARDFRYDCENFAGIAKISLGLRKFRWDCENFAILAKFSLCENFARLAKFRYLAKFTVPSEIS